MTNHRDNCSVRTNADYHQAMNIDYNQLIIKGWNTFDSRGFLTYPEPSMIIDRKEDALALGSCQVLYVLSLNGGQKG
jgi:hypothetical protein